MCNSRTGSCRSAGMFNIEWGAFNRLCTTLTGRSSSVDTAMIDKQLAEIIMLWRRTRLSYKHGVEIPSAR